MEATGASRRAGCAASRQKLPGANGVRPVRRRRRRLEGQRDAVHAVAQAGRLRPVLEHMAEMAAAAAAMHLGARDQQRAVGRRADRVRQRLKKLGQPVPLSNLVSDENSGRSQPAQAKVPLRFSALSGLVIRPLGAMLAQHLVCCGREQAPPFVVALDDLERSRRPRCRRASTTAPPAPRRCRRRSARHGGSCVSIAVDFAPVS